MRHQAVRHHAERAAHLLALNAGVVLPTQDGPSQSPKGEGQSSYACSLETQGHILRLSLAQPAGRPRPRHATPALTAR